MICENTGKIYYIIQTYFVILDGKKNTGASYLQFFRFCDDLWCQLFYYLKSIYFICSDFLHINNLASVKSASRVFIRITHITVKAVLTRKVFNLINIVHFNEKYYKFVIKMFLKLFLKSQSRFFYPGFNKKFTICNILWKTLSLKW